MKRVNVPLTRFERTAVRDLLKREINRLESKGEVKTETDNRDLQLLRETLQAFAKAEPPIRKPLV